jgi:hypothetical protein
MDYRTPEQEQKLIDAEVCISRSRRRLRDSAKRLAESEDRVHADRRLRQLARTPSPSVPSERGLR